MQLPSWGSRECAGAVDERRPIQRSIGGYLAIKGHLSLGALVAVLAAYTDMTSPWKELLDYYQQKEDMTIRFQQVVREFFIESSARQ